MKRLIVVSNRLAFTVRSGAAGLELVASAGGLVSALGSYLEARRRDEPDFQCLWVGWPGSSELSAEQAELARSLLREQQAIPVFLSPQETHDYYDGFCNDTLWPLFHYFPSFASYDPRQFETYRRVNELFRDAVLSAYEPGDTIWVHDYQLMLLPRLLREVLPAAEVGFFLHIPFPSYELFRLLPKPWKEQLTAGMLGADLIGFHTYDYTQCFLDCVFRTLGYDHHLGQIVMGDQTRRADTFPIGIDFDKFMTAATSEAVAAKRHEVAAGIGDRRAIFSVDRLDYTKGILDRLEGYKLFLTRHPEWHDKVVFLLAVVPSRTEVPRYQQMKQDIDMQVGQINGIFGTMDWVPVLYQYRSLEFEQLVALYALSPVALITPLRDGMNLVAKEYLASKADATGVLVLSEMAGAARELGESILINPNHHVEIADALHQALSMDRDEQIRRNRPMQERLRAYDARRWATHFLASLARVKAEQGELATSGLTPAIEREIQAQYRSARRRLLFLDYDGTLVPFAPRPELARPGADLLRELVELAEARGTQIYIISGRDRATLEDWFGALRVHLIAEHGVWIKQAEWRMTRPLAAAWKGRLAPILRTYATQVAGSLFEDKEFSIAWHYRLCDPVLGAQRAKELISELTQFTANLDVQVLEGKKVVEIRNAGVDKGKAAAFVMAEAKPEFVLAAGDDLTDEDLFRAMPEQAFSIRVGAPFSHARYHVADYRELRRVLAALRAA